MQKKNQRSKKKKSKNCTFYMILEHCVLLGRF